MNKKNVVKILLDLVMAVLMVLMFNKRVISMSFHEIGGLSVCLFVVIHLGLNQKWIRAVSKKFFSKNLKMKVRIGYIIDFLLLLSMAFIGISGIFISKTILTGISSNNMIWKTGHQTVAGFALILLGIHVGLHWSFIKGMVRKAVKLPDKIIKPAGVICLILLLGTGIYSMKTTSFMRWIAMPFTVENMEQRAADGQGQYAKGGYGKGENNRQHLQGTDNSKDMNEHKNESGENQNKSISISNLFKVILNFLSIMAVFAWLTVCIEIISKKFINKQKV